MVIMKMVMIVMVAVMVILVGMVAALMVVMMGMTGVGGDDVDNRDSSDGCSCDVVLVMMEMFGAMIEITVTVSCGSCGCDGSGGDDRGGDSGDNRDDGGNAEDVLVALAVVMVVSGSADGSGNIRGDCRRGATSPGPSCLFRSWLYSCLLCD